ncbi:enhancer of polycomb homolog 1-like isoform X2 [Paramormyrops kingsleyae]
MVIPVPEAESNIAYYDTLYPGEFRMPKQLIHIQPFSLDAEQPDYDLDTDDEAFVTKLRKKMEILPLQFEEMIDRLEKGSGQQLVTLQEAKLLLKEDDELIREVFDYWTRKRKTSKSAALITSVKQEKRDGSSTNDPYVAFRRRTEKMQTRKNRKNDEASYEKMLKLRRDLSRAVTILEMIKRREKSKRELLHLTLEIVEKRYTMADFGGEVMAELLAQRALVKPTYPVPLVPLLRHQDHAEYKPKPEKTEVVRTKRKYEKRPKAAPLSSAASLQPGHSGLLSFNAKDMNQYDFPSSDDEPFPQVLSGSSETEEENDPDGPFAFRRKAGCQYFSARLEQSGSWAWCNPADGGLGDARYRYSLTTLTVPHRCVGLARRRFGRGGRVLLDRAHSDLDHVFHALDPDATPLTPQPLDDTIASTSETNTSDRAAPGGRQQVLLNIKSCRWRYFRPRTARRGGADGGDPSGAGRAPASGPGSQARTGPGAAPVAAFTMEQYQQHQEQLALMQRQQLEQTQLQLQQASAEPPGSNTQGSTSKTLDSASAQFAVSALVTTEQLLAAKAKDETALGLGVNGVLPGSGVYKTSHHASGSPAPVAPTGQPAAVAVATTTTTMMAGPTFHQPPANNGTTVTPSSAAATQVLIGNNIRLSVPPPGGALSPIATLNARHISRTINAVPPSALKLAAAAGNCQMPKVTAASSLDMAPRENHDQEKTTLNSISDNTVAMEVT